MKRFLELAAGCVFLTIAAAASVAAAGDVLSQLGITRETAAEYVVESFGSGQVPVYAVRGPLQAASPQTRAMLVEQAMSWGKAYASSPAFKAAYLKMRDERKPGAPEAKGSVDDEIKAAQAEQQKQFEEARKSIAALPPEQRKQLEATMKQAEQQKKELEKNADVQHAQRQGMQMQRDEEQKRYEAALAAWQQGWPSNPRDLIVRRLRQFLATSASVDFDAKVIRQYGQLRFASPAYEAKPQEWKQIYRAGRLPVEKARAFAQAWLAELGAK